MDKEELLREWTKHKKAEEKAKKKRVETENELIGIYGLDFQEQSKTFNEENYKVSIKKNVVHKLDQDAWLSTRQEIPEHLRPEKISFSLDVKGFEYIKANEPEIYKKVSDCVEIKENKPTIKVEKI